MDKQKRWASAFDEFMANRIEAQLKARRDPCPRCPGTMVWRHESMQCPKCQFKEGCCG